MKKCKILQALANSNMVHTLLQMAYILSEQMLFVLGLTCHMTSHESTDEELPPISVKNIYVCIDCLRDFDVKTDRWLYM